MIGSASSIAEKKKGRAARTGLWRAWRWWLPPVALSLTLALLYLDPFVGDWDALDYTVLSLRGQPSSMALGRSLFIFTLHALWRAAHAALQLPAEDAYLVFKGAVLLTSALAALACWALARELTESYEEATIAALLIALSPSFVIYSGQVMTEIPSIFVLGVALIVYLRGVRGRRVWLMMLGAALLGADVNIRETVGFYAPWLVAAPLACGWRFRRSEMAMVAGAFFVFLLFALGPFTVWFLTDASGFRAAWYVWRETMIDEAARHPVTLRNALPFFTYFFITSPPVFIALPFAFVREWRERGFSPLFALACVGLLANALLFFNYSTTINWRYFLTALPALAPLVASFLIRSLRVRLRDGRRAFPVILACVLSVAPLTGVLLYSLRKGYVEKHALIKEYREHLRLLPQDAVVMAGGQTVSVTYWRGAGSGNWDVIGTGSGWPGARLVPLIESYLKDGRRVYLDTDPRLWTPCGWQREEIRGLVQIQSRFRFRRVSDTLFELRPMEDQGAVDAPRLDALLPENRPAEVKKCAGLDRLS